MDGVERSEGLELREYLLLLRRRRWVVVGAVVATVTAALLASFSQTKIYSSSAEVLFQPRTSEEIFSPDNGAVADRSAVDTEIAVMKSGSVQSAVAEVLGFVPNVSITARGDTRVIVIASHHREPETAAHIANTYAMVYIDSRRERLVDDLLAAATQVQAKINDIDSQLAELDQPIAELDEEIAAGDSLEEREELQARQEGLRQDTAAQRSALQAQRASYSSQLSQLELAGNLTQTGGAQLVSEATPGTSPIRPNPMRNAMLGLVVGLLAGVGLAFLRDYLDDSVRTKDDLERATGGHSVLGMIPAVPGWKEIASARVISIEAPSSPVAEAYRTLRTSIQFLGVDQPRRLVQVTSANASEGKTTTLANLAVALGRAGQRVIIVCCDLRRPRVHQFFNLDNSIGFTSVLVGDVKLADAIQAVPGENRLHVLASGPVPPNPSELLGSARTKEMFDLLKGQADIVLVDSPPLLPVTDGLVLAGMADATVLVASASVTTRKALGRAVELLNQVGAPLVGSVLNGVRPGADGYGYRSSYSYTYTSSQTPPLEPGRRGHQLARGRRAPSASGSQD